MTLTDGGETTTYRLRGVMRDPDPRSAFATLSLEPLRTLESEDGTEGDGEGKLSAAG
ncbi:MAG: hypothetical protein ACT4OQ_08990 [Chloroflexota bacterium]